MLSRFRFTSKCKELLLLRCSIHNSNIPENVTKERSRLLPDLQPLDLTKKKTANFEIEVPTDWQRFLKNLPQPLHPFVEASRLDKPTGTLLLLWPCYWGVALATKPEAFPNPTLLALFGAGAIFMRSAGVAINDLIDKDFDKHALRTKDRPIASGRLSTTDAVILLGGHLGLALTVLLQFDFNTIVLCSSSLALVFTYPLMKRITYWPQLVLGMAFNWGALVGYSAASGGQLYLPGVLPLYTAGICWTLIYDTIYAHQDRLDDIKLGLKSTAIKFGDKTKTWLTGFSAAMVSSLFVAGVTTQQTWPFYVGLLGIGAQLGKMVTTLDIDNRKDCDRKFQQNSYIGLYVCLAIVASTLIKPKDKADRKSKEQQPLQQ